MRPTVLALAFAAAASVGCSSMTGRTKAGAAPDHKTPVASERPSLSQKILQNRLQEGQKVMGKTEVEGALIRK